MRNAQKQADVAIIGGGPAGLSAAVWCVDLGLQPILFEKADEFGGQMLWTHNPIRNYLGAEAANGRELRDIFLRQVAGLEIELVTNAEVGSVDLQNGKLKLTDGEQYSAENLIIATGVRRRRLGIAGESEFVGRGMLESGVGDREHVRGRHVVVIGGGDAAIENAILLAQVADKVTVIHRREQFSARPEFLENVRGNPKVRLHTDRVATAIRGDGRVEEVSVADKSTGEIAAIGCDAVLVRIGVEPNNELFLDQVALDSRGYVLVDSECRTNVPNVSAIGDIASPNAPTIATAVGMGATAAKSIASKF